ncbi:MAG: ABC transporter substrate-binding protein [Treponema sp.]|nr:ABC transporter substrate-binding protein [Treponema sp.]
MKKITLVLTLLSVFFCYGQEAVKLGILTGPSCVPAAYVLENYKVKDDVPVSYEKYSDPQALVAKILTGEINIGFLPVNVAAKVYNSTEGKIQLLAVVGRGNLKVITVDNTVNKFTDLKGRSIAIAGQGATPEYVMRYLLKEYGYADSKKGVNLDFSIPTNHIPAQLLSGKITTAVVPEPFATIAKMKSEKVRTPIDLQDEYLYFSGASDIYPLTVLVVSEKYASQNKELINDFQNAYADAVDWTINHPGKAGILCEKYNFGLASEVIAKAIPVSNYCYVSAADSKKSVEDLLQLFYKSNSTSIGGKLPDDNFYYK